MLSDRPDFSDGWIKYYFENGKLEKEGIMKKNTNTHIIGERL